MLRLTLPEEEINDAPELPLSLPLHLLDRLCLGEEHKMT
jgi:hypothetical protein